MSVSHILYPDGSIVGLAIVHRHDEGSDSRGTAERGGPEIRRNSKHEGPKVVGDRFRALIVWQALRDTMSRTAADEALHKAISIHLRIHMDIALAAKP